MNSVTALWCFDGWLHESELIRVGNTVGDSWCVHVVVKVHGFFMIFCLENCLVLPRCRVPEG